MGYILVADGACSGNPGPGGWAFDLFIANEGGVDTPILSGDDGAAETTNNRMELEAVRTAFAEMLTLARDGSLVPGPVALRLDSQYVLDGLFQYLENWKARGWKTAAKKPVKNAEIWQDIDAHATALRSAGFTLAPDWVKGHDGDPLNEEVDRRAQEHAQRWKANAASDAQVAGALATRAAAQTAAGPMDDAVTPDQIAAMRAILEAHDSGYASVADTVRAVRAQARALGIAGG